MCSFALQPQHLFLNDQGDLRVAELQRALDGEKAKVSEMETQHASDEQRNGEKYDNLRARAGTLLETTRSQKKKIAELEAALAASSASAARSGACVTVGAMCGAMCVRRVQHRAPSLTAPCGASRNAAAAAYVGVVAACSAVTTVVRQPQPMARAFVG